MIKLLMIADDFTGALDSGVQLAVKGAKTRVILGNETEVLSGKGLNGGLLDADVLAVDAETRHLSPREAYEAVYRLAKEAVRLGIPYLFKKTDSALRGNVGAELAALLDASGEPVLSFFPGFPRMDRITKGGIHYVEGIPVDQSVFGRDPFEPVKHSFIPDMIKEQSGLRVVCMPDQGKNEQWDQPISGKAICVYDSQTDEQMLMTGKKLYMEGRLHVMAGCAGLAEKIPAILGWNGMAKPLPRLHKRFLVICGSINPITKQQLAYAVEHGFLRERLNVKQKLCDRYFLTPDGKKDLDLLCGTFMKQERMIIDTNDPEGTEETWNYCQSRGIALEECRMRIAETLGILVKGLLERGLESTILVTGGDTLLGFLQQMDGQAITPVCEMASGTVLFQFQMGKKKLYGLSKSGGFGGRELMVELAEQIAGQQRSV